MESIWNCAELKIPQKWWFLKWSNQFIELIRRCFCYSCQSFVCIRIHSVVSFSHCLENADYERIDLEIRLMHFVQLHLIEDSQYDWCALRIHIFAYSRMILAHLVRQRCCCAVWFSPSRIGYCWCWCWYCCVWFFLFYYKDKIASNRIVSKAYSMLCHKSIRPSDQYFMHANGAGIQFNNNNNGASGWKPRALASFRSCYDSHSACYVESTLPATFSSSLIDGVQPHAHSCNIYKQ